MARYFFHVHNGIGLIDDEDGRELLDLGRAREEAIKGIRSIVSDEALQGRIDLSGRITIADETGAPLLTVKFEEAFEVRRGSA
jgi:hypothetical protein